MAKSIQQNLVKGLWELNFSHDKKVTPIFKVGFLYWVFHTISFSSSVAIFCITLFFVDIIIRVVFHFSLASAEIPVMPWLSSGLDELLSRQHYDWCIHLCLCTMCTWAWIQHTIWHMLALTAHCNNIQRGKTNIKQRDETGTDQKDESVWSHAGKLPWSTFFLQANLSEVWKGMHTHSL